MPVGLFSLHGTQNLSNFAQFFNLMEVRFVSHNSNSRLILFFAGWAMDATPFVGLHRPDYDVAVVWDYRDMTLDTELFGSYDEICVVAWSLGVYAAALSTAAIEHKVTRRIAVNGTLHPVDDLYGIPRAVFEGTRRGLDQRALYKFYRRVAGSREAFETFGSNMPSRDISGLCDELDVFLAAGPLPPDAVVRFDIVLVGTSDAIFPQANQIRAWDGYEVETLEASHLLDFQTVLDRYVVDKQRVGERFAARRSTYNGEAVVQSNLAGRMMAEARKHGVFDAVTDVLEIGCGSGILTGPLAEAITSDARLVLWDIAGDAPALDRPADFVRCDAEIAVQSLPDSSLDLIASASTVQWFNSPARFFAESLRVLRKGAFALIGTFCKGNLAEVAECTGAALSLPDADGWKAMIPDGFEIVFAEEYCTQLSFDSPYGVFEHLRATGVNALDRSGADTVSIRKAAMRYPKAPDGTFKATYKPLLLILRKL